MATVNFSVPDDVKEAFNTTFCKENKSAIIAPLMREAVDRAQRVAAIRPDALLLVLPADHLVRDQAAFAVVLKPIP